MKLSASMIVKNEESCLERCLKSIAGVDELVIVDTGSEDNTVEIAKKYTDKVFYGPDYLWRDDFSFSRNQSLSKCTGDWVLIIDADETLEPGGIEKIRNYIKTAKQNTVYFETIADNSPSDIHHSIRLFKNNAGIHWAGRIHNYLSVSEGDTSDIKIYYGYSLAHQKDPDRALRICTKVCEENPNATRERFYLAREYWYRNDFKTAAEHYHKYISVATWWPESSEAYLMLARCYWHMQEGGKAREYCLHAIRQNPDFKEALLFMSEIHFEPWKSKWKRLATAANNSDVLFIRVPASSPKDVVPPCILQVRTSEALSFYADKIPLIKYSNHNGRCLFNGIYYHEDAEALFNHNGEKIVFWNGSDVSRVINDPYMLDLVKKSKSKHYCHNYLLSSELRDIGIDASVVPILFSNKDKYPVSFKPSEVTKVFMNVHDGREDEYGVPMALELAEENRDIEFHIYGISGASHNNVFYHGQVSEEQIDSDMKNYQGCLRFNSHDGASQIVMKSSLMGLYTIVTPDKNTANWLLKDLKNKKTPSSADTSHIKDVNWFLTL